MTDYAASRCPIHGIPDCSPLLNGCGWSPEREVVHRCALAEACDERDRLRRLVSV